MAFRAKHCVYTEICVSGNLPDMCLNTSSYDIFKDGKVLKCNDKSQTHAPLYICMGKLNDYFLQSCFFTVCPINTSMHQLQHQCTVFQHTRELVCSEHLGAHETVLSCHVIPGRLDDVEMTAVWGPSAAGLFHDYWLSVWGCCLRIRSFLTVWEPAGCRLTTRVVFWGFQVEPADIWITGNGYLSQDLFASTNGEALACSLTEIRQRPPRRLFNRRQLQRTKM